MKIPWGWKYRYWVLRDRVEEVVGGKSHAGVLRYNDDKPHRCPRCHAVADADQRCKREVVTCCTCGARFTRWPRFQRFLKEAGVVCTDHWDGSGS